MTRLGRLVGAPARHPWVPAPPDVWVSSAGPEVVARVIAGLNRLRPLPEFLSFHEDDS